MSKNLLSLQVTDLENLNSVRIIPLVDLEMLKSAIASTEWLLSEKKLFGGHYTNDFNSQTIGVYYRLRELDTLNLYLDIYNRYEEPSRKKAVEQYLCEQQYWCPRRDKVNDMIGFLDTLANVALEFVNKDT